MKTSVKYRIHRTLAIIVVPLLILSTITGILRANQKWYWEEGYKKKKQPATINIDTELVSVNKIKQNIDSVSGKKNAFAEISIKDEVGNNYYYLLSKSKQKYLADAATGLMVSPLKPGLASTFAAQYIKEPARVKSCDLLMDYIPRKGKEAKPAYKVEFDNVVHSQVFIDYYSGEILEDLDDNRHFGIWMIRLHEYDFLDSKRSLSTLVGVCILLVALSGLWIYRIRLMKKQL